MNKSRYTLAREQADRVNRAIIEHCRKLSIEAGLDPNLLGIHPHNAMISFRQGAPWENVDYSKVRLIVRLLESQFDCYKIVDNWVNSVRERMTLSESNKYLFG